MIKLLSYTLLILFASASYLFNYDDIKMEDTEQKILRERGTKPLSYLVGFGDIERKLELFTLRNQVNKLLENMTKPEIGFDDVDMNNLKNVLNFIQDTVVSVQRVSDIEELELLNLAYYLLKYHVYLHLFEKLTKNENDNFMTMLDLMFELYASLLLKCSPREFPLSHYEELFGPYNRKVLKPDIAAHVFLYILLEQLMTLPKDKSFSIIFKDKIPPTVAGGTFNIETNDFPSLCKAFLENELKNLKSHLASKSSLSEDELAKDPNVRWFEENISTLRKVAQSEIIKRNWYSSLPPTEQKISPGQIPPPPPEQITDTADKSGDPYNLRTVVIISLILVSLIVLGVTVLILFVRSGEKPSIAI